MQYYAIVLGYTSQPPIVYAPFNTREEATDFSAIQHSEQINNSHFLNAESERVVLTICPVGY